MDNRDIAEYLEASLEPTVKTLLRLGFSAQDAEKCVRHTYVRCFFKNSEFWRNEKPTVQHCALKTGLQRTEIKRLLEQQQQPIAEYRQSLSARVLSGWVNDKEFQENGQPRTLPYSGPINPTFRGLVGRYGLGADPLAILTDLKRAGCVQCTDDGYHVINQTYGPDAIDREKLHLATLFNRRLAETTDHNLTAPSGKRRFQRVWRQLHIPADSVDRVHDKIATIGSTVGREIDLFAGKLNHATPKDDDTYHEVGVVIYAYIGDGETVADSRKMKQQGVRHESLFNDFSRRNRHCRKHGDC